MSNSFSWKTLSSKTVYQNQWIKVREDKYQTPNGNEGIFGVIEGMPFALIIPKIGEKYLLIEQYRYTIKKQSFEFPAGGIETGDSPEQTAVRELAEEAGVKADTVEKLGFFYTSNGITTIGCHVFLATGSQPAERKLDTAEEGMRVVRLSAEELAKKIRSGEITDGPTIAAFGLLQLHTK